VAYARSAGPCLSGKRDWSGWWDRVFLPFSSPAGKDPVKYVLFWDDCSREPIEITHPEYALGLEHIQKSQIDCTTTYCDCMTSEQDNGPEVILVDLSLWFDLLFGLFKLLRRLFNIIRRFIKSNPFYIAIAGGWAKMGVAWIIGYLLPIVLAVPIAPALIIGLVIGIVLTAAIINNKDNNQEYRVAYEEVPLQVVVDTTETEKETDIPQIRAQCTRRGALVVVYSIPITKEKLIKE
jgi:hypothetical protein